MGASLKIIACAFCGYTIFRDPNSRNHNHHFRKVSPPSPAEMAHIHRILPKLKELDPDGHYPPYVAMNLYLEPFTRTAEGQWWQCYGCTKPENKLQRMQYLTFLPPRYARDIRGGNPFQMQLLSLVDTKMTLSQHLRGAQSASFYNGRIVHTPRLQTTMTVWDPNTPPNGYNPMNVEPSVQRVYAANIAENPLYADCMCILERPRDQPGIPIVYPRAVAPLVNAARARNPDPSAPERPDHPHLLIANSIEGMTTKEIPVFNMGTYQKRNAEKTIVPCLTAPDGLPIGVPQVS